MATTTYDLNSNITHAVTMLQELHAGWPARMKQKSQNTTKNKEWTKGQRLN